MSLLQFPWSDPDQSVVKRSRRPVESFQKEMNRLMDSFFNESSLSPMTMRSSPLDFSPSVDFSENEQSFNVKAELPGLTEDDIEIEFHDQVLVIKGEKKVEEESKEDDFHRIESSYGSFYRSFTIPVTIEEDKIDAKMKNGVLKVTLPKAASVAAKTKKIKVQPQ